MDDELRNSLWSALTSALWQRWAPYRFVSGRSLDTALIEDLTCKIWVSYLKQPLDGMPAFKSSGPSCYEIVRRHFFEGQWWQSYDLIEFLLKESPDVWKNTMRKALNAVLEMESAAYRIVDEEVVQITDTTEIEAIETALDTTSKVIRLHLSRALELLSDRKEPDYRNSIKESISAVEAASKLLTAKPKAELGDCLKVLKSHGSLHPAFEQALKKLYGYSSDEGGIRHALTDESVVPTCADAKFMLVACSAFINFLWTKAAELRIEIDGQ
jgi:hypothetical protein